MWLTEKLPSGWAAAGAGASAAAPSAAASVASSVVRDALVEGRITRPPARAAPAVRAAARDARSPAARAAQQSLLSVHEREVTARGREASRRELGLAEGDRVLRQRQPLDDAPQRRDSARKVAAGGADARHPRLGADVVREAGERRPV